MNEHIIGRFKNISFGMPTLKGRRLTVYDIIFIVNNSDDILEAMKEYELSEIEIKAAIEYCKNLKCQEDKEANLRFCHGCLLVSINEGDQFNKDDYDQISDTIAVSKTDSVIILGSLDDIVEEEFGKPGWALAAEAERKMI